MNRDETMSSERKGRALAVTLGLLVLTLIATATTDARGDERASTASTAGVVNINTATAEQLGLLPGIGETKARAIVAHRQRRPFARIEDLVAVRGIGRSTLRRLRPYLAVRGETTLTRAVPPAQRASTPERTAQQPARSSGPRRR